MTFRVEVNYVEIDAIVTDAQGNFVRNLTKDDFEVVEEGKPQELSCCRWSTSRSSGRTRRSSRRPRSSRTWQQHQGVQRPRVRARARRPPDPLRAAASRVRQAAKQFVERYLGANDIAAIVADRRAQGRRAGVHEQPPAAAARRSTTSPGQKIRSATLDKIDDYYMQREYEPRRGAARPERSRARLQGAQHAVDAAARSPTTWPASAAAARRSSISAKASTTTSTTRSRTATRPTCATRCRRRLPRRRARNVSFYGIDPRGLSGAERRSDRHLRRFPNDPTLGLGVTSLQRRAAAIAGQPARPSRKRPAASPPSTATTSATPSRASSRTTAATTCSATTRTTPGATAASGACRSASSGRA